MLLKWFMKWPKNDSMNEGLKILTKSGNIIYDSAWIAGVDYEEDKNDDDTIVSINRDEDEVNDEMDPN
jgi:hypothetical protein